MWIWATSSAFLLMVVAGAFVLLRPASQVIPWIGLAIVAFGTGPAFAASVHFVTTGTASMAAVGYVVTAFLGFAGMGIILLFRLPESRPRPRFFPLSSLAVGLLYLGAFWAWFPPWLWEWEGTGWDAAALACLVPGVTLIVLGIVLSRRYGPLGGAQRDQVAGVAVSRPRG